MKIIIGQIMAYASALCFAGAGLGFIVGMVLVLSSEEAMQQDNGGGLLIISMILAVTGLIIGVLAPIENDKE